MSKLTLPFVVCLGMFSLAACADDGKGPSDKEIRQRIIKESIAAYDGACPCPESVMKSGQRCGKNSAYSAGGGDRRPVCYPSNVSDAMVKRYREEHPAKK
jgi:hypothetical protein